MRLFWKRTTFTKIDVSAINFGETGLKVRGAILAISISEMLKMLLVDCNQIIQRHLPLKPTFYATFPVTVLDDGWKPKDLSVVAISFTLEVSHD